MLGHAVTKLPDVLSPGLKIVFCGTAAGKRSAERGAYYAKPGNRFWPTLARVGLTPRQLRPDEYLELLQFGLGLTDLAKDTAGMDASLTATDIDVAGLQRRVLACSPRVLAFNGKRAASEYLSCPKKSVRYGWLEGKLGPTNLFVLPSTSGAAASYWDEEPWRILAEFVQPHTAET
jgi:double-stranded uracil-DNA glycosylase